MEKLDLKDRKILYHLDLDSRQSFTQIGKKAGLHKDAVARRVKKLIEKDIIYNFYTYIDLSKLGYTIIRYYFVLQYATPKIKDEIIKDLVQNKFSMFVNTNEGQIDLSAYFGVKNIYKFQKEWNKFYRKYRNYFSKTIFSIWCFENMYTYFNLLDENANKRTDKDKVMKFGGGPRIDIDELDNKILKLLAPNSRISTIEIAQELGVTASTISARIKNLKKKGIIVGHKIDISYTKLNLNFYRLDIDLKNYSYVTKINDYMIDNPNVKSHYESLGDAADLEYEINLKNVDQLHQIMSDLTTKYPESIKNYRYHRSVIRHKIRILPDDF